MRRIQTAPLQGALGPVCRQLQAKRLVGIAGKSNHCRSRDCRQKLSSGRRKRHCPSGRSAEPDRADADALEAADAQPDQFHTSAGSAACVLRGETKTELVVVEPFDPGRFSVAAHRAEGRGFRRARPLASRWPFDAHQIFLVDCRVLADQLPRHPAHPGSEPAGRSKSISSLPAGRQSLQAGRMKQWRVRRAVLSVSGWINVTAGVKARFSGCPET
jgi:hypothetical protein